jgi:hypothetical protein
MITKSRQRDDALASYQKFVGYSMIFGGGLALLIGVLGALAAIRG